MSLTNTVNLNKCETVEKMSSESLTQSDKYDSVTKDASPSEEENCFSSLKQFNSSANEIGSKSLSDKHMNMSDTENSIQSKNKNDLNGKDFTDNNTTNNSDTVNEHKMEIKSGALTNSSENNKVDMQLESDGTKIPHLESNTLQKCDDTYTGDILVGKRKRENTADEDLRKKQLKTETIVNKEKTVEKSNTDQTIVMESEELDELEKEIFDDNGETSDTQDEDTVMKNLTLQSLEDLSQQTQKEILEPEHDKHNKDLRVENQEEHLENNQSEFLSQNVKESPENEDLLSKNSISKSEENSSVTDSEKCVVHNKVENGEPLEESNEETTAEVEENVNNVKDIDYKMNKVEDNNLDIPKCGNKESENKLTTDIPIENENLKNNEINSEKVSLEKDNLSNNKDLDNGSSENSEMEEEIESQHVSKNIVNSCEEKIDKESSVKSPECNSGNLINTDEENEKVTLQSEVIETSDETIKNDGEEKIDKESSVKSPECNSDNLINTDEENEKVTTAEENKKVTLQSEVIETSDETIKNDGEESVQPNTNTSSDNIMKADEKEKELEPASPSDNIETTNEMVTNDGCDSVQSTSKDIDETVGDIIIGEAFTIDEDEMKDSADDDNDKSEKSDAQKSEVVETKKDESTPSVSSVGSSVASTAKINRDKPSRRKVPSKTGKKNKRSSIFGVGKKKKKTSAVPKLPPTQYVAPMKLELDLPSFLQELASIDPSLHVARERYDEDGKKLKVHCIVFHETILDWVMSETLLSAMDNTKALRTRLKVKNRSHLYSENYDSKLNEIHPVSIGDVFPFSMPRGITSESVSDKEEVPLPFPLENLVSLCPSAAGFRIAGDGKKLNLKSVSFADEPLEWAFKETFLSSFDDSPILSNIFELNSSSNCWPDFADVILTNEGVNFTFPFACPNSKKYFENFLFSSLSPEVPISLRHETLQIPSIRADLERDLYGERDSLVRLLAVASFYKHSSCIPAVRTNRKLSVTHAALVASFRPLIISQANKTAKILRDIRADLLKDVSCQDPSIIPCMINGPLHCKRGFIFSHLQRLEAAVAKDPNNKLQNI